MKLFLVVLVSAIVGLLAVSVVVLDEREQAFITLQGDAYSRFVFTGPVVQGPALAIRIPGVHRMVRLDRRLQLFESPALRVGTRENQAVQVRYNVLWRVADPRLVAESTQDADLVTAIDGTTQSIVRTGLGQYSVEELLSSRRGEIVDKVRDECRKVLLAVRGIEVVGLALRDVTFPDANLPSIFSRMKQERGKVAAGIRAEGEARARRIRAEADAEAQRTLATARGDASRMRGDGEARSTEIYAQAYGQDPEFYEFLRSLEAYEKALDPKTTIVLSPNSPFLRYLSTRDALQPPRAPSAASPSGAGGSGAGPAGKPSAPAPGAAVKP